MTQQLADLTQLSSAIGIGRHTIRRLVLSGDLPRPVSGKWPQEAPRGGRLPALDVPRWDLAAVRAAIEAHR